MRAPAISVLMAVRNGERYLSATLESLRLQTFEDFEVIVVDDGSSDATPTILEGFRAADPRIKLLRNETGMGLPTSLNRGLEMCAAPLVARADADDLYDPQRLLRQHEHLMANPQIGVLSCGFHRIDHEDRRIDTKVPTTGPDKIRFRMMFTNSLLHPGAMLRAGLVRKVGGYDPAYWTAQDSDLWARLLPHTQLDNLPEPLVSYRVHPSSTMRTRGTPGRQLSLTVPQRLQEAYLGAPQPDAHAAVDLYQSFSFLDGDTVHRGEKGLSKILARAERTEPVEIVRDFRRTVVDSLGRQARWRARNNPMEAARIVARAVAWRLSVRPSNRVLASASS